MVSGKNIILLAIFTSLIVAIGIVNLNLPKAFIEFQSAGIMTLHPQATVLVILIGFLFFSLVIDHRAWSATKTAPICPCQTHFYSIPQIESTRNINLLHHLAGIPDEKLPLSHIAIGDKHPQERNKKQVPQLTITHFSPLPHKALIQMASRAKQNFSFSPGFLFVLLARGPPNPT